MHELEQQLISKVQSGDRSAFEMLFKTYYKPLVYIAESILHDGALAEEVVQDVFVKIWKAGNTLSIEKSLYSYLTGMARNRSVDYIRNRERSIKTVSMDDEEIRIKLLYLESDSIAEGDIPLQSPELDRVKQAIEQLPTQCKQIFLLSRIEDYSYSEIAEKMQISVSTVKTQMGRAMQKLKNLLVS